MVISLETAWGVEDMYRRELKKKKKQQVSPMWSKCLESRFNGGEINLIGRPCTEPWNPSQAPYIYIRMKSEFDGMLHL